MKTKEKQTNEETRLLTGAQIIVEALVRENVKHIFGIPGGACLPIFDAFYGSKVNVVLTRHEQGATHMADGYARSTGKVGVCIATSGPGATNLVTGLATANMDSIPIVAITGQVATHLIGNDAFQEADATGVMRPVTKHNYMVKDVRDLPRIMKEAFHIATTGRPGPVHIDIPVDIQKAKLSNVVWPDKVNIRSYKPKTMGHPKQIDKAVELLNSAERPLLYVGGGAILSGAREEIIALSEKAGIPVVHTLMANGAFPFDHPNYVGILGMHGKYSANIAMQKCDLLMSCGARFDDRVTGNLATFSKNSKKIHIDIDPANIGKTVAVDVPVVGDLKTILKEIVKDVNSLPKCTA
jgi:acetolactate synthase-1/2/3 large subunit